ncbi:MAG: endonuclease/exonuclease/phosphatase family protein [Deltaproteobacteria bacterium]|nr:endonuclease/exonuclease/phosphatase family protein [Nannocystaceae bacterium]
MGLELKIASANMEHWIVADGELIDGRKRKPRDFETKLAWAKSVFGATRPHIIGMQEIYDDSIQKAFEDFGPYKFHYSGGARQQVALATTLPLAGEPDAIKMIQQLEKPIEITRNGLTLKVDSLSRPILRARLVHEGETLTVFVAHLKSKIPSYGDDPQQTYPEEELLTADFSARPLGNLVSLARRAAEAAALRREVVQEAEAFPDRPIIVCGDLNDDAGAVTTDMVLGDSMRTFIENRHQLSDEQLDIIYGRLHQHLLTSAQDAQTRTSAQSEFHTAVHEGRFSTLDHVFLSRHFFPKPRVVRGVFKQSYFFNYYEVANDHLVDDASEFAPRKPASTDHGVVFVYCKKAAAAAPLDAEPAHVAPNQPNDLALV